MLKNVDREDIETVVRINKAGQPGVCALSSSEITQHHEHATLFCVLMNEGQPAGYVIAYGSDKSYSGEEFNWFVKNVGDSFLYIDQIAIDANHRASGLGSHLYAELKSYAYKNQYPYLVCEVNLEPPNPVSMAFHQKNGFVQVGQLHVSDGRTVALMQMQVYALSASDPTM
jgi:predicted GNAT superfamily acetyltransferase